MMLEELTKFRNDLGMPSSSSLGPEYRKIEEGANKLKERASILLGEGEKLLTDGIGMPASFIEGLSRDSGQSGFVNRMFGPCSAARRPQDGEAAAPGAAGSSAGNTAG